MSADKIGVDAPLARRLVAAQFPQWANLSVRRMEPGGWDNYTFRLGDNMTIRLPSAEGYVQQVEKEHRWLPRLAPFLPLPIPTPLRKGQPSDEYKWPWSIYRWIEGETASPERIADLSEFATALARFLAALQQIEVADGPPPGPHNFFRGGPVDTYNMETRKAIISLEGRIDTDAATEVWEAALAAAWRGSPMWLHGDVSTGNLLVTQGRLSAVIDFGCSGAGDPACDLAIAWTLFKGESRNAFRAALPLDDTAWARGRGWALWKALITLQSHRDSNAPEAAKSSNVIEEVVADHRRSD